MSAELVGLTEIFKDLDSITDIARLKLNMGKACALVERSAKEKAPKGNGDLRRSITSEVAQVGADVEGKVYTPLEYAPYVEFGTGLFAEEGGRTDVPWSYQDEQGEWHTTYGMHPHPYLRPALYENTERIKETLKRGLLND